MESTILFGNGINLLGGGKTWNRILMDISDKAFLPPINSNTLKYEYIILPQDEVTHATVITSDGNCIVMCDGKIVTLVVNTEDNLKRNLCNELKEGKPSSFYNMMAELSVNHYITTNYELFLNNTFIENGFVLKTTNDLESRLYKHEEFESTNRSVSVWNIHGDINNEKSIMLGLSDYCKYVAEIDKYLNNKDEIKCLSWINLLLNTNVHIVGLGMAYEEIDLWNVLTTRMRMKRKDGIACNNHIYYYAIQDESFDTGKKKLLEAMGVEVIDIAFDWSDDAYKKAYDDIYKKLSNTIMK